MRSLTIPGKPLGKQRPRVLKSGITYTPKKTVNYETLVRMLYIEKYTCAKPFTGPVCMLIRAYYQIPKSASKKRKKAMREQNILPTIRPDVDNIIKIIADALNGLAYDDDKQIVSCCFSKFYSDTPRAEVDIMGAGSEKTLLEEAMLT